MPGFIVLLPDNGTEFTGRFVTAGERTPDRAARVRSAV